MDGMAVPSGPGGGGTHPAVWQDMRKKVALHHHLLQGNGEPRTGLVVRVDRLEQSMASIKKAAWLIASTLIGLFIMGLWNSINK